MNTIDINPAAAQNQELADIVEEIATKLQAGEPCNIGDYTSRYPEFADRLRDWMNVMTAMADLGHSLAIKAGSSASHASSVDPQHPLRDPTASPYRPTAGILGDFRILREVGRGGMGVVYEAEQISLGRNVALKVLPFAAMLDKQQLARFKNEARAAATLDHPNIVAIYSVGAERGVHFYAMQLIEGRSLAEIIVAMKPGRSSSSDGTATMANPANRSIAADTAKAALPTVNANGGAAFSSTSPLYSSLPAFGSREYFRAVASLGIQAAEALDHAHQNGILHRDIKPANLLVDDDAKLYITDFGLARIEQDAGLTMTGDILGTLRYMSPEQALAKRVVVDHRSDMYSLGVTLYELLTLQPAFTADDRQELLRQIAFEEPRKPRQINAQIPQDLETIILKTIEKDAADRYTTAFEMAEDLRRFHNDQSIRAKAPAMLQRVRRWSRRHQRFATAVGAATVFLCVVLVASMVAVRKAQRRTEAALEETSALLYATDIALSSQFLEKGWVNDIRSILDRYRPSAKSSDRRGLEWFILDMLSQPPASFILAGHRGPVREMAVFPNQKRIASVGADGTLQIWDIPARRLQQRIQLCSDELHSVAISPDGMKVAAGNTSVYLFHIGQEKASRIHQSEHTVESLTFTPDGQRLVAGSRYDEVCLLSLDGEVIRRTPNASRVDSLEFVPGTPTLVVPNRRDFKGGDKVGFVQLWDERLSTIEQRFDSTSDEVRGSITLARPSPCGRFIAAGERYLGTVHIFNRNTGSILTSLPGSREVINDLAYSADGQFLATGGGSGRVECFRVHANDEGAPTMGGRPLVLKAHEGEVTCVRFLESGELATCGEDGLIRVTDRSASAARSLRLNFGGVTQFQLSPDGDRALCIGDGEAAVFDVHGGDVLWHISRADRTFNDADWSPTGEGVALYCSASQTVDVLDGNGRLMVSIAHGARPYDVAFSPDGSLLAIISTERLQLCRAADGKELFSQPMTKGRSVAFSHDGTRLAYGETYRGYKIIDLSTKQVIQELVNGSSAGRLVFSPDDSIIASCHSDSIIRLWDVGTGSLRAELAGHEREMETLAFSPDGRTLLSAGPDWTVRAWSVDHGRAYGILSRRSDPPSAGGRCAISLSSDARCLAIGYSHGREGYADVTIWEFDTPSRVPHKVESARPIEPNNNDSSLKTPDN